MAATAEVPKSNDASIGLPCVPSAELRGVHWEVDCSPVCGGWVRRRGISPALTETYRDASENFVEVPLTIA